MMDEIHRRFAIITILGMMTTLNLIDMLTISLLSDNPNVVEWAENSLRQLGEMRKMQIDRDGDKRSSHKLVMDFIDYLDEPRKTEKIVIGFSNN